MKLYQIYSTYLFHLNQNQMEERLAYKSQPEPTGYAKIKSKVEERNTFNIAASLSVVLKRTECGTCGERGELCAAIGCRSVKTFCHLCQPENRDVKTKEIYKRTLLKDTVVEKSESKLPTAITKPKQRKSIRQELIGTMAQRREEQMTEILGKTEVLQAAQQANKNKWKVQDKKNDEQPKQLSKASRDTAQLEGKLKSWKIKYRGRRKKQ